MKRVDCPQCDGGREPIGHGVNCETCHGEGTVEPKTLEDVAAEHGFAFHAETRSVAPGHKDYVFRKGDLTLRFDRRGRGYSEATVGVFRLRHVAGALGGPNPGWVEREAFAAWLVAEVTRDRVLDHLTARAAQHIKEVERVIEAEKALIERIRVYRETDDGKAEE